MEVHVVTYTKDGFNTFLNQFLKNGAFNKKSAEAKMQKMSQNLSAVR